MDPETASAGLGRTRVLSLAGLGRSGTTLIEGSLAATGHAVALGEVIHLWDRALQRDELCGCGSAFSECAFWAEIGERAFGGWANVDAERMVDLRESVDKVRMIPRITVRGDHDPQIRRYRWHYEQIYRAAAQIAGAQVVIDSSKQPSLSHVLAGSKAIDLRVVHCVRDARAVAHSWTKAVGRPEARGSVGTLMTQYGPLKTARHWAIHNTAVEALRARGVRVSLMRYEDFVADATGHVEDLLRFAGVDLGTAPAAPGAGLQHSCSGNPMRFSTGPVSIRRDDAWMSALPASDRRKVTLMTAPLLARYGYDLAVQA